MVIHWYKRSLVFSTVPVSSKATWDSNDSKLCTDINYTLNSVKCDTGALVEKASRHTNTYKTRRIIDL